MMMNGFYPLIAFFASFVATAVGALVAAPHFSKPLHEIPWPERARGVYPVLKIVGIAPFLFAIFYFVAVPPIWKWAFHLPNHLLLFQVLGYFGAFVGAYLGGAKVAQIVRPRGLEYSFAKTVFRLLGHQFLTTWPVHFTVIAVVFFLHYPGGSFALPLLVFSFFAIIFYVFGGGFLLGRIFGIFKPAGESLKKIAEEAAQKAGAKLSSVYEFFWPDANAFALPLSRRILFAKPIVKLLTDEELSAIALHEAGHLLKRKSYFISVILRLFVVFAFLGGLIIWSRSLLGTERGFLHLLIYIAAVAITLFYIAIFFGKRSRRLEQKADATVQEIQLDPLIYARALEKLYEHSWTPAVLKSKAKTHPDLYDRLMAVGVQPAWPKPLPPSARRFWAGILFSLLVGSWLTFGFVCFKIAME